MKHYYVTGYRQIEEVDEPMPSPGMGEVVVEVAYTALSPGSNVSSYMNQARQTRGEALYMGSGIVREVGAGVQRVAPGDRVVLHCGHQAYALVAENAVHRVPVTLSLREASISYLCSWSVSALHLGQYAAAESVVVVGQGLVGASAALVADLMGARVLALDSDANRVAFSRTLGLGTVVQAGAQDAAERIAEFLGETGPDLILETSGSWHGFRQAIELARDYTRLAIMGIYRQPPPSELGVDLHQLLYAYPSKFHYQRLQIIGCGSDPDEVIYPNPRLATRRRNYAYVLEQAERGRLPLAKLITHRFPPQEIGSAAGRVGRWEERDGWGGLRMEWNCLTDSSSGRRSLSILLVCHTPCSRVHLMSLQGFITIGRRISWAISVTMPLVSMLSMVPKYRMSSLPCTFSMLSRMPSLSRSSSSAEMMTVAPALLSAGKAAMVPNTSDDLPDPETPVNTVSRRLGISTLTSFRLFSRAPWTRIRSWLSATCWLEEAMFAACHVSVGASPRHLVAYGSTNKYRPVNRSKTSGSSGK